MATIQKNTLGSISGKLGSLVFYNYNGRQIVRSMPIKSTKPPTLPQQAQHLRIALVSKFFPALRTLITKGYKDWKGTSSGYNLCTSYHLKNAITGEFPNLAMDFSKVVLTRGLLTAVFDASINCNDKSGLIFTWKNSDIPYYNSEDEAILVTYNPAKRLHVWKRTAVQRVSEAACLTVPESFSGDTLHCWITFISADGKQFSNSKYLGTVTVI